VALILGRVSRIFRIGFPHTTALVRLPAKGATGSGEVLSGDLCGLLGLGVADFVVEHFNYLSFICAFIIAQKGAVVNPQFDLFIDVLPIVHIATAPAVPNFPNDFTIGNQLIQLVNESVFTLDRNHLVVGATHHSGVDGSGVLVALNINSVSVFHFENLLCFPLSLYLYYSTTMVNCQ
jgi:hypothetical protein